MNGIYQVSNQGRIKSLKTNQIKKPTLPKKHIMKSSQYYQVGLHKNNISRTRYVHRLVAEAFIPNPDNLPQVNHIDCNPLNNCVENLEWCTAKYNSNHQKRSKALRL